MRFAARGNQVRTPTPVQVIPSSLVSSLSQLTSSFVNGGGRCTMYSSKARSSRRQPAHQLAQVTGMVLIWSGDSKRCFRNLLKIAEYDNLVSRIPTKTCTVVYRRKSLEN